MTVKSQALCWGQARKRVPVPKQLSIFREGRCGNNPWQLCVKAKNGVYAGAVGLSCSPEGNIKFQRESQGHSMQRDYREAEREV